MILACQNISKSFGIEKVLDRVSFHIEEHEKAAIVGINGAGKSTLLNIITGKDSADSGEILIAKETSVGYLLQYQDVSSKRTIYEELLSARKEVLELETTMRELELAIASASPEETDALLNRYTNVTHAFEQANGYALKSELTGILKGLGFTEAEFDKKIDTLSGGQKTRVSLGKLLLTKPDLLLLDEPTNHLDMNSIIWLETYLKNYEGAVLIVAHDRYFLNRIVSRIIEIESGKSTVFNGDYSHYSTRKEQIRNEQIKRYLNQQAEIKHQEAVIEKLKSYNREKSVKRARSREKALDKIERVEKPTTLNDSMHIKLEPHMISGNDVLTVEELSKSFPGKPLFHNVSFEIKREEKVALIGDNGTGKTTILKILNGLLDADYGTIKLGSNVVIGYYDQEHQNLSPDKTLFDEISDTFPDLSNTEIRSTLASFLFTGDDVFKRIGDLSGGERGRVSLAKLMLSDCNFLILDEPTNHLDMISKEILETALRSYTGTVFFVSHDRYFINQVATRILDLTTNGLLNYIGNYDYYLEKKQDVERAAVNQASNAASLNPGVSSFAAGNALDSAAASAPSAGSKEDWQKQKEEQARKRKLETAIRKTEEEIERLETEDAGLDEQLSDPAVATSPSKLLELTRQKDSIAAQLEELYAKWEELQEEL